MTGLRLFPARAAIGTAVDSVGRSYNVYSTPEFNRALTALLSRVGGETAISVSDIETLLSFVAPPNAELIKAVEELKTQLSLLTDQTAAVAEVKKYAQDMEISYSFVPPPTDWEHPGKIGAATANSGAFTTISATGQITSTVSTGTAPFVVASTTQVSNLNASQLIGGTWAIPGAIGSTTRNTGAFTTLNVTGQITSTLATGTAPFVVASTTEVANLRAATATALATARTIGGVSFNGTANITVETATGAAGFTVTNGFGCNSKAAQTAFSVGAAATDLASVITLANNIRTALINNGIASA